MAHLRGLAMVVRYGDFDTSAFAEGHEIEFNTRRLAENAVKVNLCVNKGLVTRKDFPAIPQW